MGKSNLTFSERVFFVGKQHAFGKSAIPDGSPLTKREWLIGLAMQGILAGESVINLPTKLDDERLGKYMHDLSRAAGVAADEALAEMVRV